ncbi:isoprenoid synthase domain-containing protein [Mycena albidolilacea]|uniref:Terpene synthase n=1 Tax=Mycena albidolilacea TaxID=1033008 RepID=A0AAD6Z2T3_9AGAR|nr:isoprenoid synthase domain-containing protein [Mycena albidolilacea]
MSLVLPDIHERWSFTVAHSRSEATISDESTAWIESLGILSGPRMKAFRAANFGYFTAIVYGHFTDARHHRVACDLVNLLFVFDDLSDELPAQDTRTVAAISLDALCNWKMPRVAGEHPVGEMHRRRRLHFISSAAVLHKFMHDYDKYLTAVIAEAEDRDRRTIRGSLDTYLALRRETGAATCCFDLLLIPYEIPGRILRDSRITHLEMLGLDLVCVGNDILSFNIEQARGDTHNSVIVVMHERGLSSQDAMDFMGVWYREKVEEFCTAMRDLPPCGSVYMRDQVKMYVTAIANWVTGNYEWGLRSDRYFPAGQDPLGSGWVVPLLESSK